MSSSLPTSTTTSGGFSFDATTYVGGMLPQAAIGGRSTSAAKHQHQHHQQHHNMMMNHLSSSSGCRSPYQGPSADDSDDDGASDYASHRQERLLLRPTTTNATATHPTATATTTTTTTTTRAAKTTTTTRAHEAEPDTLLQRFYETTVDAPCRQVACQGSMEEQLDLLTHCQRPLPFWPFFQPHDTSQAGGGAVGVAPDDLPATGAYYYVLPAFCEYCHAARIQQCAPQCTRPALYLQKKRPPFTKPKATVWDPCSDEYLVPPTRLGVVVAGHTTTTTMSAQGQTSWLSMFSHSDGGD